MSDQIPSAEEQAPDIDAIFEQLRGQPMENQVPALLAVIQALIGQMSDVDARLCALDKEIHEDFFGPIHKSYQDKVRGQGIEGLKQKYGSRFDALADPLKAFGIDDVYSFLFDKLEELRKAPDYSPDQEEPSIDMFHKGALDRIGRVRGTPKAEEAAAAEEKPATAIEVAIEKKPTEEPKEPAKKGLREKKMSMLGGY
jgi:hypothetical protein